MSLSLAPKSRLLQIGSTNDIGDVTGRCEEITAGSARGDRSRPYAVAIGIQCTMYRVYSSKTAGLSFGYVHSKV